MKNTKRPNNQKNSYGFLFLFGILFAGVLAHTFATRGGDGTLPAIGGVGTHVAPAELSFSDVVTRAADIDKMTIRGTSATGVMRDGTHFRATVPYNPEILARIADSGVTVSVDASKSWVDHLGIWVPIIMGLILIWWIVRGMRGGPTGGIGRAIMNQNPTKINTDKPKTTFKDVAGIDSEKQELMEIVDFLKDKDKFRAVGARVPRGVLLAGDPGTGKTLLARAIAGEANVPFFAASGSDFSGIIVGLGVAKIKEIFDLAKKNAPCILFIDEIDAIGQRRSQHSFNDQDREQTLNQLLIEMDGFANDTGVIVLGATNRPDMLDPALLRPGRFDRQVQIDLPDLAGRREILDLYAKKVKIDENVNLQDVARGTTGFSGADLENLLNEAALHAVRNGRKTISDKDIDEARDKILMGPRKIRKMRPQDIKLTAYHEAGHAFISLMYADVVDPIHKATIIPRGRALGMVQHLPIDDKVSMTIAEVRANLAMQMAGRAAEEVFFGADKITTGAEADIAAATHLARYSITTAGLSSRVGLPAIKQVSQIGTRGALESASEKTAEMVDAEIRDWLDAAHRDATRLLTKNRARVERLADELLKRETLTGEEIREIVMGGEKKRTPRPATSRNKNATRKTKN